MRLIALITRRLAVFALGALSVWLIVFVFRFTDRRLPTILALSLVYALAAYVLLPQPIDAGRFASAKRIVAFGLGLGR